jgi:hypothetical protein
MNILAATRDKTGTAPGFPVVLVLLGALTIVRLIGLDRSLVDLYFDESQYWAWSRELSFGYFSKPPLLAWVIALAEGACGASEACIRAPAPLIHLGTSLLIYAIARHLYDGRVAFCAAFVFALAPGIDFSARIISTDVPLLFFWALALLAFLKLVGRAELRWAIVLGLSLGLGMLAKYAMAYFLFGIALAALLDRDARALLGAPLFWLSLVIAAAVVAPNVWWNFENGFATLRHLGDNVRGPGLAFSPFKGLEFIASQFAAFGPVAFVALLYAFFASQAGSSVRADRLLIAFTLPALVLITLTAFLGRANANWAAVSYVSASALAASVLVRLAAWRWLAINLAIGVAVQVALLVADARADRLRLPFLSKPAVYERTLGWRALGEEAKRLAARHRAATIAGEGRDDVASMIYYARDARVLAWPLRATPSHHFDLTRPLKADAAEPILIMSRCPLAARFADYYASVEPLGRYDAPAGPGAQRSYFAFLLKGARKPIGPLAPCR